MKVCFKAAVAFLAFALVAGATDFPKYETYLGYTWIRYDLNSHFEPSFNANGGTGQFDYNVNKWLGIVTDISATTKGVLSTRNGEFNPNNRDTTVLQYTIGPRVYFRGEHHGFTPFIESMFGGSYGTTSTQISALPVVNPLGAPVFPNSPVTARLVAARTGFAMFAGGGVDYRFGKHFAVRAFEVDYNVSRVPALFGQHVDHNNLRITAGANFTFGKE
jgi:hypothetical protein